MIVGGEGERLFREHETCGVDGTEKNRGYRT